MPLTIKAIAGRLHWGGWKSASTRLHNRKQEENNLEQGCYSLTASLQSKNGRSENPFAGVCAFTSANVLLPAPNVSVLLTLNVSAAYCHLALK